MACWRCAVRCVGLQQAGRASLPRCSPLSFPHRSQGGGGGGLRPSAPLKPPSWLSQPAHAPFFRPFLPSLSARNPCDDGKMCVGYMDVETNGRLCDKSWVNVDDPTQLQM